MASPHASQEILAKPVQNRHFAEAQRAKSARPGADISAMHVTAEGISSAVSANEGGDVMPARAHHTALCSRASWFQHRCNCIALAPSGHALDLVAVKHYRLDARHDRQPMLSMRTQLNAGVLSRFTRVRVIIPHAGAYVPYQAERIATAGRQGLSGGPGRMAQLKRLYFDTAMSGETAFPCERGASYDLMTSPASSPLPWAVMVS